MHKLEEMLKSHRAKGKFTLTRVAKEVGISVTYLRDLEKGNLKRPKLKVLHGLAAFYGINSDDLVIASRKVPQDVYWKIIDHPHLLETIRNLKP